MVLIHFFSVVVMLAFFYASQAVSDTRGYNPGRIDKGHTPTANVFGTDDRVQMTSTQYPWSTIGYLSTGCTGTLVARNLMLTAAHCAVQEKKQEVLLNLNYFYPNMIRNNSSTKSWMEWVWWGDSNYNENRAGDWAIVRLSDNIGDTYGWMGTRSNFTGTYVVSAGYHGDFEGGQTAGVHVDCSIRSRDGNLWKHDCDTTRGSSGGPLFFSEGNDAYIVAVNVAENRNDGEESLKLSDYHDQWANYAVPGAAFVPKLMELWR